MTKKVTAFYAYPSQPPSQVEIIENAAKEIGKSGKVKVKTWTQLQTVGRLLIGEITAAINRASLFACDLTYLNDNVIFELGFAIGRLKHVWISLNVGVGAARDNYGQVHPTLVDVGYTPYQNSGQIVSAFLASELLFCQTSIDG